jgi:hypothetical protein
MDELAQAHPAESTYSRKVYGWLGGWTDIASRAVRMIMSYISGMEERATWLLMGGAHQSLRSETVLRQSKQVEPLSLFSFHGAQR